MKKENEKMFFLSLKYPCVEKQTGNPLSFETGSLGAVSGILMTLSSTPNYFPRHKLSICNVAGAEL